MGTWGTAIKDNDTFADIYDEFFDQYNNGGVPAAISKKLIDSNPELLDSDEDSNSFWFALALAQWETKILDPSVLKQVEYIVTSGADLILWQQLEATPSDIKKRKIVLDKFLEKIKSDRPRAKPRKRRKHYAPIFETGDCLVFKISNGYYGGAVVVATDVRTETGLNLVAITRLKQPTRPSLEDFENAEVVVVNRGVWQNKPDIIWYSPVLFHKQFAHLFQVVEKIEVQKEYIADFSGTTKYFFGAVYTANWNLPLRIEKSFEWEELNAKPEVVVTIKQLIKKDFL
jgi:hypothetical protein